MPQIDLDDDEDTKLPLRDLHFEEAKRMAEFVKFLNNIKGGPKALLPSQFFKYYSVWRECGNVEALPSLHELPKIIRHAVVIAAENKNTLQRQLSELSGAQLSAVSAVTSNFNE